MAKIVKFTDNDSELIKSIQEFQKVKNIPYFVEAVRILCKYGLQMKEIVENLS